MDTPMTGTTTTLVEPTSYVIQSVILESEDTFQRLSLVYSSCKWYTIHKWRHLCIVRRRNKPIKRSGNPRTKPKSKPTIFGRDKSIRSIGLFIIHTKKHSSRGVESATRNCSQQISTEITRRKMACMGTVKTVLI